MKLIIVLLGLSFSLSSLAGWKMVKQQYAFKSNEFKGIRNIMRLANELMVTGLNKENFTSLKPIKLRVAEIKAQVFRWENDQHCRVTQPQRVPVQFRQYFKAIYSYFPPKGKSHLSGFEVIPAFKTPCDRTPINVNYHFRYFVPGRKLVKKGRPI